MSKYNIYLDLNLQNSVVKKLNQEQKLLICAASASLPSSGPNDNQNNKKNFIAILASAMLATSGVAIVIESNEKFLRKEWSKDMLKTGVETLVLGGLNKLRQAAPFGIRGSVNRDIINALCSVYDIIEPYSNVIICIIKGDDIEEIVFEALKSIDNKYSTSFSGVTFFEIKSVNNVSRPFGTYDKVERVVKIKDIL
ncbi:hypothetical protein BpHYR1_021582 [Brachionus plicatilis]|uniref:Uncharacterized protein n=1 Tax=Brachionus plicatilis TaxID=10195 RepID=A0A3M7SJX1_BRAPC|nr:hypothetical protein BpHYR1_021582 [Brachionus plicatilis]